MPAIRLDTAQSQSAPRFSAVGVYRSEPLVAHVALLNLAQVIRFDEAVPVTHMCPPLTDGSVAAHLLGWFDRTSLDDIRKIELWINDVRTRVPPSIGQTQKMISQYTLQPPILEVRDQVHGRLNYFRFSCAGFIVKCYEDTIGIRLLEWQSVAFPKVSREMIRESYPPALTERLWIHKDAMGLFGEGPWALMMPGYVIPSLSRPTEDVIAGPYMPASIVDASYP